ncbi:hypothetical protein EBR43_06420 [bacterium]|nr:hypothetical protein [bacterium]
MNFVKPVKKRLNFPFIFFLVYILCSFFYLLLIYQFDWYEAFYQKLSDLDVKRYRLLQIWVQGDRLNDVNPIGGDQQSFFSWKEKMSMFLEQANKNAQKVHVVVELVLDRRTQDYHHDLLQQWQARYPLHLIMTSVETMPQEYPVIAEPLKQCSEGIPAVCSDILRVWHLQQPYDINVYMDIDTFIFRSTRYYNPYLLKNDPLAVSSDVAFGAHLNGKGIYHSLSIQNNPPRFIFNNDFIVDYHADHWALIKSITSRNFMQYQGFLDLISMRSHYLNKDYKSYQEYLQSKKAWAELHPFLNINQVPIVMMLTGPAFWQHLYLQEWSKGYEFASIPSSGEWMNATGSVYGAMNNQILKEIFNDETRAHIINMMFMAHDYHYFKKFPISWINELKKDLLKSWAALTEEERFMAEQLIRAPASWTRELYEHP